MPLYLSLSLSLSYLVEILHTLSSQNQDCCFHFCTGDLHFQHNVHTIGNVGRMKNANINNSEVNDSWKKMEVGKEMEWISPSKVVKPPVEKKAAKNKWN